MGLVNGSQNRGVTVSEKPFSSFVTFSSAYAKRISQYDGENRRIRSGKAISVQPVTMFYKVPCQTCS